MAGPSAAAPSGRESAYGSPPEAGLAAAAGNGCMMSLPAIRLAMKSSVTCSSQPHHDELPHACHPARSSAANQRRQSIKCTSI